MAWASAYPPAPRLGAAAAEEVSTSVCTPSTSMRELQDVQADMQRQVNDIKQSHARWLPGRFGAIRRQLLFIARLSVDDALPKDDVMAPLWPPVPRSKDVVKNTARIDTHGHVIGLKLWARAVLAVCRHGTHLAPEQKVSLCAATAGILNEAAQARHSVSGYDRWRLKVAHQRVEKMAQSIAI